MTDAPAETDLETAILALYQTPFEEFIGRRDTLAKNLRAEKRRDDAALVKALRKPSRMASVLDRLVSEDAESVHRLAAAIAAAQTATDLPGIEVRCNASSVGSASCQVWCECLARRNGWASPR